MTVLQLPSSCLGGVEAGLESFDFAEPAVGAGLGDAFAQVLDDLDESWFLAKTSGPWWLNAVGILLGLL
ncbi:hypothetical protein GCM10010191_53470 [Actinomadura vinacea]|uniref:Uncharacterized protein n=1 Tax=Actinomadura vinacea TaxID=115336 RepID=A0ABN3JMD0_9ACTN